MMVLAAPAGGAPRSAAGSTGVADSASRDSAYALAIQKDGKLVAAGSSNGRFALARYRTDGRLDGNFGRGGAVFANGGRAGAELLAVAVQRDGKILAGGGQQSLPARQEVRGALLRFTSNGKPDRTFGRGGQIRTAFKVLALTLQRNGAIVVAGAQHASSAAACSRNGSCVESVLARYTVHGVLDRSFGTSGKLLPGFDIANLAVQADGRIVAVGAAADAFVLARYDDRGSLDTSFGSDGKVSTGFGAYRAGGAAAALQADGKIVAAGTSETTTALGRFALARYKADGELDAAFGSGGKIISHFGKNGCGDPGWEYAHAVAIQPDGKIVVAGTSNVGGLCDLQIGPKGSFVALARYRANGSLDPAFGTGGKVLTHVVGFRPCGAGTVLLQADGKIVAAGDCLRNDQDFALVRYTTRGRLDATFGSGGKVLTDFGSG
jgi:uncharacterized delta-60 repeat protein